MNFKLLLRIGYTLLMVFYGFYTLVIGILAFSSFSGANT